jgi:hypothetical protein
MLTTGKFYIEYRLRCTLSYMHVTKYVLVNKRKSLAAELPLERSSAPRTQFADDRRFDFPADKLFPFIRQLSLVVPIRKKQSDQRICPTRTVGGGKGYIEESTCTPKVVSAR